jgi:hypothetical protein
MMGDQIHDPAALPPRNKPNIHMEDAGSAPRQVLTFAGNLAPPPRDLIGRPLLSVVSSICLYIILDKPFKA